MKMLAEDIEAGGGELKIRQSGCEGVQVGVNIRTMLGKVIFRNDVMELILSCAPTTDRVPGALPLP